MGQAGARSETHTVPEVATQIMALRFVNDIIKPWDELNALLAKRYAFQPDLSDVTRMAAAIAVAIRHYPEKAAQPQKDTESRPLEIRLMTDVADAAKHGALKDSKRNNTLHVAALFECNDENNFRFIRNGLYIAHESEGEHDFMTTALIAINYMRSKYDVGVVWEKDVLEAPEEFYPTAFLHYNSKYCINMSSVRISIFRRTESGALEPYDSPSVKFEIY